MLDFATCQRLYDAIPAFRAHAPTSGDWIFFEGDDPDRPARPCLIDTDGSALLQHDDEEPGVLHRDLPEGQTQAPFRWCPRLDQLIVLAMPYGFATLKRWPSVEKPVLWLAQAGLHVYEGSTPDEALATLLWEEAMRDAAQL